MQCESLVEYAQATDREAHFVTYDLRARTRTITHQQLNLSSSNKDWTNDVNAEIEEGVLYGYVDLQCSVQPTGL